MKEHNKECIKYFPVKEGDTIVPIDRKIPRDELEEYLSQEYRDLIQKMRGQRIDNAFSNYDRFPRLNKYQKERVEELNKSNFSVVDVHENFYVKVRNFPGFGKQQPRTDNWLKPEILKEVQANQAE